MVGNAHHHRKGKLGQQGKSQQPSQVFDLRAGVKQAVGDEVAKNREGQLADITKHQLVGKE